MLRPGALAGEGGPIGEAAVDELGLGVVLSGEDTLFDLRARNAVSRADVAALAVGALSEPRAEGRVVEVAGAPGAPPLADIADPWLAVAGEAA